MQGRLSSGYIILFGVNKADDKLRLIETCRFFESSPTLTSYAICCGIHPSLGEIVMLRMKLNVPNRNSIQSFLLFVKNKYCTKSEYLVL